MKKPINSFKTLKTLCATLLALGLGTGAAWAEKPDKFVEYLQSDGSQYINLGEVLSADVKVNLDYQVTAGSGSYNMFGYWKRFAFVTHDWLYIYGKRIVKGFGTSRMKLVMDAVAQTITVNGSAQTLVAFTGEEKTTTSATAYLFWANGSTERKATMKVWSCVISNSTGMVAAFYPCVKDGKPGLYDVVSKQIFYDAAGSSKAFTYGDEVDPPPGYATEHIKVDGSPAKYGVPTPDYGELSEVAFGTSYTFTCPAAWTNDMETTAATCAGWKLVQTNGTETAGEELTKQITYSVDTACSTLTWLWNAEHKVTVSGDAEATGAGWYAHDAVATLEVKPTAGKAFSYWTGDGITDANKTANPLSLKVTAPMTVTPVFTTCYYVAPDGDDATTTPSDPATPYKTLETAVAKCEADTVISVAAGTYALTNELIVSKAFTLEGAGWQTCIISNTVDMKRTMSITAAKAVVKGFTITGGRLSGYNSYGSGVYMNGGTLANCRVTDNQWGTMSNNRMFGYGIYLANASARVTHCIIDHNGTKANTRTCGGGIYANAAATVDNCLIANNESSDGNGAGGGAGIFLKADATFTNCTIADNTTTTTGGGAYGAYGTFVNCVFYGNVAMNDAGVYAPDLYTTSDTKPAFRNCLFEKAVRTGDGNVTQDPVFSNAGDYTLMPSSLAIDGGDDSVYAAGDLDLAGNPRKQGGHVDAGCYESDPTATACGFYASTKSGKMGDTFTLHGGATGFAGTPTFTWTVKNETTGKTVEVPSMQEPSVTLTAAGSYSVSLEVSDGVTTKSYARDNLIFAGATTCYVDPDATGSFPYDSKENAASTFEAAYKACAEGGEILLVAKTIPLTTALSVTKAVTIRGTGNRDQTVLKQTAKTTSAQRVISLNNPNAVLANVTVTGGYSPSGAGIYVGGAGGFVTNCVITGNTCAGGSDGYGVLYLEAGRACDCFIYKNSATQGRGFPIKLTGSAVLERSIISENTTAGWSTLSMDGSSMLDNCLVCSNSAAQAGALYYNGNSSGSGTLRNCTITKNSCNSGVGGVNIAYKGSSLTFVNCIIAGNKTTTGTPDVLCVAEKTNSFVNCLFSTNPQGATAIAGDPGFKDVDHGDFRLGASSKAIDAGTDAKGLGDYDLEFNDRVRGKAVDVGCYEADPNVLSVAFTSDATEGFLGVEFAMSNVVKGVVGTPTYAWKIESAYETITSEEAHPVVVPKAEGWYTVTLTVTCDSDTATSTVADYLHVAPKNVYVTEGAEGAEYPYDTPAKATSDMARGWKEAIDGTTIHVSGKIVLTATLTMDRGVTIVGVTGKSEDGLTRSGGTVVLMNHASAVLRGLTIYGGTQGVYIASEGGLVEDCVLTGNDSQNGGYTRGGGAYLDGATAILRRTIITNNKTSHGGGVNECGGAGVWANAGLMENCLVAHNFCNSDGNGVLVFSPNVTVRNCTIAHNTADSRAGGGLYIHRNALANSQAPAIVNCLIVSNMTAGASRNVWTSYIENDASKDPNYSIPTVVERAFTTCALDVSNATINAVWQIPADSANAKIVGDPCFNKDGSYRLTKKTPESLRGCAMQQDWMVGATDLYGKPRCDKFGVEPGCCQAPFRYGLLFIVQ